MPNPEKLSRQSEGLSFSDELDDLQKIVGPNMGPLPEKITEKGLQDLEKKNVSDNGFESFNEQYRNNELIYRRAALQRESAIREKISQGNKPSEKELQELVVANQAGAYYEYFQKTVNHVVGVLKSYEILRKSLPQASLALQQEELKIEAYVSALSDAMEERVAFANVLLLDARIAEDPTRTISLIRIRDQKIKSVSDMSQKALSGTTDDKWRRGNELNQRIIDILSGDHGIQGLEEGFLPQAIYIDLLKESYESLLEEQKRIARDAGLAKAKSRLDQLKLKHDIAEDGNGEFNDDDVAESEALRRQINDRNAEMDRLGEQRREVTSELIALTQKLGEYQVDQAELSAIQNQFGESIDFTGANPPSPDGTPHFISQAINNNMERRKNFHLDQMDSFLHVTEEEMLEASWGDKVEDRWNKDGREIVNTVNHRLARFFTYLVPEMLGMRERAFNSLTEELDDALGWPSDIDPEEFKKLPPEEQERLLASDKFKKVRENALSIIDAIENFDRGTIERFKETMSLIRQMPSSSEFAAQDVVQPLPTDRVTLQNRAALEEKYGAGTVYLMLFEQMDGDFGDTNPESGFIGEYKKFLESVDKNIDVHIDVGAALHAIKEKVKDIAKGLSYAAIAAFGAGIVFALGGGYLVYRFGKAAGKAALKQSGKIASGTFNRLRGLAGSLKPSPGLSATPKVVPNVPSRMPKLAGRFGKILGPAVIIFTGYEAWQSYDLEKSLSDIPEKRAVDDALELMKTHPQMNRDVPRYNREIKALEQRQDILAIREVASIVNKQLSSMNGLSGELSKEQNQLLEESQEIVKYAGIQNRELHDFFPITDYIKVSSKDPKDVVRVAYRQLNECRSRGIKNEGRPKLKDLMNFSITRNERARIMKFGSFAGLENAYQDLLKHLGDFLEKVDQ
ncbi:MAG: hypothetical protein K9M03_01555 [Kiritimatiellales bacterium]|nr:hypothetical protein [Kiritimatiellales bacterium]